MSLATLYSRANAGIDAPLVTVEVHLGPGLPGFAIVGLPEKAVQESKDRVRGALVNCAFDVPQRKITVNLGPADLPKEGGRFDLPIALGILAASGQLDGSRLGQVESVGELALSGALRPTRGVLPVALAARAAGRSLLLPHANAPEAALVRGLPLYPAGHLLEVCAHLNGVSPIAPRDEPPPSPAGMVAPDLADVRGQCQAKRALEIAAAGGHSLLMIGPPGTGKSMLASRLPGLLPLMDEAEALETAAVVSLGLEPPDPQRFFRRPFRAPHHSASAAALVGGTGHPRPGEISLAHNGVLFLDELPEFDRRVLEVLREPLETGRILISRAARKVDFPARFQLVAAMNPCPCGFLGDARGAVCSCTPDQIARYRARVSGPLLDRIDMQVEVPAVSAELLGRGRADGERSAEVRARVERARVRQLARQGVPNAHLASPEVDALALLQAAGADLLRQAVDRLRLSARAYYRILKLALTIADLEGADSVRAAHVAEAVGYRRLDRGVP
jgi:magnesium chelatase family protein